MYIINKYRWKEIIIPVAWASNFPFRRSLTLQMRRTSVENVKISRMGSSSSRESSESKISKCPLWAGKNLIYANSTKLWYREVALTGSLTTSYGRRLLMNSRYLLRARVLASLSGITTTSAYISTRKSSSWEDKVSIFQIPLVCLAEGMEWWSPELKFRILPTLSILIIVMRWAMAYRLNIQVSFLSLTKTRFKTHL